MVGCFVALSLVGCSAQSEADPILTTAADFRQAVSDGDGQAACELLNNATRLEVGDDCATAITALGVPTDSSDDGEIEVEGHAAIVEFDNDTLFFAKTPDGWRITAAGCIPQTDGPYSCTVKGP